jgi:RNA polymerase sigma-70 factor (ECF subfamily)
VSSYKDHESQAAHSDFATTHWSVVLRADADDTTAAPSALAKLCQTYWFPLYAFVRRRGYNVHDAQDLTQEFFARLLRERMLAHADPQRGRFRSFLLANLKNFLANEWRRAHAQKRGGGQVIFSLDYDSAETSYRSEPASDLTPEMIFDKHCAMALLDRALERLEKEDGAQGSTPQFKLLKKFLTDEPAEGDYAAAAAALQVSPGAVAVAVHRLRARFREAMRAEVAETVATPADVDEELRHLCAALM